MEYLLYFYIILNVLLLPVYFFVPKRATVRWHLYSNIFFLAILVSPIGYFLAKHTGIGDNIWGNEIDGYSGDDNYRNKEAKVWFRKYFPDFWWSVIRNPVHNLSKNTLSAKGVVTRIEKLGNLTIITLDNNKRYFFYYNEGTKYLVKFGWKFWSNKIKVGKYYSAEFVLNP